MPLSAARIRHQLCRETWRDAASQLLGRMLLLPLLLLLPLPLPLLRLPLLLLLLLPRCTTSGAKK